MKEELIKYSIQIMKYINNNLFSSSYNMSREINYRISIAKVTFNKSIHSFRQKNWTEI